jgi:NAD(P)-dependent dehydrogenase (short-subunit alcohol dehydrogenase family)
MSTNTQKVAIVTGGATGIGKAVAQALVARGVAVVIAGRSQQRGDAAAAEIGGNTLFVQTDVSQEGDIERLLTTTLDRYGRLDYLVNNAGIEAGMGGFEGTEVDLIDSVLAINVKGVFLAIKHAAPVMVRQRAGVIINMASFVGTTMPIPQAAIYGASKAAVLSLTRAAAKAGYAAAINPSKQLATPADLAQATVELLEGRTELANGEAVLVDHGSALNRIVPMTVA